MTRPFALSLLLTLVALGSANAQVTLKPKPNPNSTATVHTGTKVEQKLIIAGMENLLSTTQALAIETRNGRPRRGRFDQDRSLRQVVSRQAESQRRGNQFRLKKENEPEGAETDFLLEVFAAMSKAKWTATSDKDGVVQKIEGADDAFKDLDERGQQVVKDQFDPENMVESANESRKQLPSKPVSKGDTWTNTITARLGNGQTMDLKTTYTYEGTISQNDRELHKITTKVSEVKYDAGEESPVPVTGSKLEVAESQGEILFDNKQGQMVVNNSTLRVKGSLTLEIQNMEIPGTLDLKIISREVVK